MKATRNWSTAFAILGFLVGLLLISRPEPAWLTGLKTGIGAGLLGALLGLVVDLVSGKSARPQGPSKGSGADRR
jgi:drug/metabolite transporter (DMT)-like permease